MGGDDLESEDEYLDQSWAKSKQNELISTTIDDSNGASSSSSTIDTTTRNKRRATDDHSDGEDHDNDDDDDDGGAPTPKKQKTASTPRNLLLQAGRGIANENTDVQAVFLWTCFKHFRQLQQSNDDDDNDDENDNDNSSSSNTIDENDKFQPSHFATPTTQPPPKNETNKPYEQSIVTFLKNGVLPSTKRLKKWKHTQSPMVLILCISARRAVSLLKDLSALNVRVAKLFAKHMNISDQTAMLEQNSYGVAVGTPNRVLTLVQNGSLVLEKTEVVLVDCYEDAKRFTVCTMNDTAPDLMELIDVAVLPQMRKRKTIRFAMF